MHKQPPAALLQASIHCRYTHTHTHILATVTAFGRYGDDEKRENNECANDDNDDHDVSHGPHSTVALPW